MEHVLCLREARQGHFKAFAAYVEMGPLEGPDKGTTYYEGHEKRKKAWLTVDIVSNPLPLAPRVRDATITRIFKGNKHDKYFIDFLLQVTS